MKNLYKKISVVALSGMIIAGGVAASGVNAQAYSSDLRRQIEDLGRGAQVYHEVKKVAKKSGARVLAAFSREVDMDRYVRDQYWDKIQKKNPNAKEFQSALLIGVDFDNDSRAMELSLENHIGWDLFRIRYKGYYFLIKYNKYSHISQIPQVSEKDLDKNLSHQNKRFYEKVLKGMVEKAGGRIVKISDSKNQNEMNEFIKERFEEGVFKEGENSKENLLGGLYCGYDALRLNIELNYFFKGPVSRLIYRGIDMLIIYE